MADTNNKLRIDATACVGANVQFGNNVTIRQHCIIEDGVTLGDDVYIDANTILRSGVTLGARSTVASGCILGEYQMDFFADRRGQVHPLDIGCDAIIRSGCILYGGSVVGDFFQTGHRVSIREGAKIGNHVSVGTMADLQTGCEIGDYSRLHSKVFLAEYSKIGKYAWIFPCVVFTNDPTPPSEQWQGPVVEDFAVVAAGSVLLPGVRVGADSLVAAGAVVTKDVASGTVVGGNPAKVIAQTDRVKNHFTGEPAYPWRYTFERGMPWQGVGYDAWLAQQAPAGE